MTDQELVAAFVKAKQQEDTAKAERVAIGNELARRLGHPTEGQKTHTVGPYKVSVKGSMNRKVDWEAFDAIELSSDEPTKVKREIDLKGLEWYAQNHPKEHAAILDTITTTPGRPQVAVKGGE